MILQFKFKSNMANVNISSDMFLSNGIAKVQLNDHVGAISEFDQQLK
jgi:hypothetical protein